MSASRSSRCSSTSRISCASCSRTSALRLFQIAEGPPGHQDAHQVGRAQQVLRVGLLKVARGPDHQGFALALVRLVLVEQHQAGRHAVAVEEFGGQHDDALDQVGLDEAAPDQIFGVGLLVLAVFLLGLLGLAAEQHALGHDHHALAGLAGFRVVVLERLGDLLQPGPVAIGGGRHAEGEAAELVAGRPPCRTPSLPARTADS